ncbi:MAG: hypothetical protein J2P16_00450 [Mycobacterium sp.]|nr:hypothetical protein [Mycobacterium sp.]
MPTDAASHPSSFRLLIRRGGLAILVFVVLGAIGGLALTKLQHKAYTATASVLVTSTGASASGTSTTARTTDGINLDTEAQLVKSEPVAARAKQINPSVRKMSDADLLDHLAVAVPANTTVLDISFTSPSRTTAQAVANAFANAYLGDRRATAQSSIEAQAERAQRSVDTLTGKLRTLSGADAELPKNSAKLAFNRAQEALYRNQISLLNQQLVSLSIVQVTPGRVLTSASLPHKPSSPSKILNLASGVAVGLLFGLFVAWLLMSHRRRARRIDDLEPGVELKTVALIDSVTPGDKKFSIEAFRRLAVLTTYAIKQRGIVLTTSADTSRADREVATHLAGTLLQSGVSVRMIRVGNLEMKPATPPGLDVLDVARADAIWLETDAHSLREALEEVRGDADVLIVDAPSPARTADAQTFAVLASAVLLVVKAGTRLKSVRAALGELDSVSAPMLGMVLVGGSRTALQSQDERSAGHQADAPVSKKRITVPDTTGV